MGEEHPLYGPFPPSMTLLENLISIPSAVRRSLSSIISYLLLVESSMWHFHITIFAVINSGRRKYTFTFFGVVKFRAWVYHVVFPYYFVLIFDASLPTKIFEVLPLSNRIRKKSNFSLPLRVFIQPCRIGK